jgi:hypothetical protein
MYVWRDSQWNITGTRGLESEVKKKKRIPLRYSFKRATKKSEMDVGTIPSGHGIPRTGAMVRVRGCNCGQ